MFCVFFNPFVCAFNILNILLLYLKILEKVKITHNAGDCGVLQGKKLKLLSCNLERGTVCEKGEASPYCTENKLNWKMAVDYCKTKKQTLFQGSITNLNEAEKSNISCLDDNDGVWVGLRRDAKTDHQGKYKDTDCPLTTSHDLEAQCGLVKRRDRLTCRRVPCTERKPFLCRGTDADGKGYKVFLSLSLAAVVLSLVSVAMCGLCFHCKKKQLVINNAELKEARRFSIANLLAARRAPLVPCGNPPVPGPTLPNSTVCSSAPPTYRESIGSAIYDDIALMDEHRYYEPTKGIQKSGCLLPEADLPAPVTICALTGAQSQTATQQQSPSQMEVAQWSQEVGEELEQQEVIYDNLCATGSVQGSAIAEPEYSLYEPSVDEQGPKYGKVNKQKTGSFKEDITDGYGMTGRKLVVAGNPFAGKDQWV